MLLMGGGGVGVSATFILNLKKRFLYEVISKGEDVSYIVILLTMLFIS